MIFCLGFLTTLNYFIYPSGPDTAEVCPAGGDADQSGSDFPPSGPTEEKASGSGFSIVEEIFHEPHPAIDFQSSNLIYLHHIAEAGKIEMFHPELILPPPKV